MYRNSKSRQLDIFYFWCWANNDWQNPSANNFTKWLLIMIFKKSLISPTYLSNKIHPSLAPQEDERLNVDETKNHITKILRAGHVSTTSSLEVIFFLSWISGSIQLRLWILGQRWIYRWRFFSYRNSRRLHHFWRIQSRITRWKNTNCNVYCRRKWLPCRR